MCSSGSGVSCRGDNSLRILNIKAMKDKVKALQKKMEQNTANIITPWEENLK